MCLHGIPASDGLVWGPMTWAWQCHHVLFNTQSLTKVVVFELSSACLEDKNFRAAFPRPQVLNSSKFPREKQRPYLSLPVFVDLSSICLPSTQQGLEPLLVLLLFSECMCLVYGKHSLRMTNSLAKGNLWQILKLFTCQLPLPLSVPELNRHFFSPIKPGLPALVLLPMPPHWKAPSDHSGVHVALILCFPSLPVFGESQITIFLLLINSFWQIFVIALV